MAPSQLEGLLGEGGARDGHAERAGEQGKRKRS